MSRLKIALALFLIGPAVGAAPASAQQQTSAAEQAQRRARLEAFRTFAQAYVGEWACSVEDFDAAGKLVWSDTQRRVFTLTMSRHFLEERAILKRPDGTEYEGGLHLTTWDPQSDRIVQHGFWLPRQPEPLFRVEGRASGRDFAGELHIREENGTVSKKRFTMRWQGRDRWLLETEEPRSDGRTYVSSRLTYSRIAAAG